MSLTSLLDDSQSNVYQFFKKNFHFRLFLKEENILIQDTYTLKPKHMYQYPWASVGHIVEYLFMLQNNITIQDLFPIRFGLQIPEYKSFCKKLILQYSHFLQNFQQSSFNFSELVDNLYRLAQIESVIRNGKPKNAQNILFSHANNNVHEDIKNIYEQSLRENLIIKNYPGKIYYNPTFEGSPFVQGADADFYIIQKNGNFLVDLKTTIHPKIEENMLFQLLGYVFLDISNKNNIQQVGIYLTRQNLFSNWNVSSLIKEYSSFQNFEQAQNEFIHSIYAKKHHSFSKT